MVKLYRLQKILNEARLESVGYRKCYVILETKKNNLVVVLYTANSCNFVGNLVFLNKHHNVIPLYNLSKSIDGDR